MQRARIIADIVDTMVRRYSPAYDKDFKKLKGKIYSRLEASK